METIYVGPPGTFDEEPTNYTIAENWSPVGVPNNVAGSSYVVTIPEAVFVDIPITITSLTLNAAGSLTVKDTADSAGLFIVGTLSIIPVCFDLQFRLRVTRRFR